VYRDLWDTILRGETWRGELENRRKDGSTYLEQMSIAPLLGPDGFPSRFVAIKRDVTEQKALEARLERMAHYDALTGLPNRVLFLDRLGQALREADRTPERVGLLFVDLDGFKDVNDTHGHEAGDALLVEVARRLTETLRAADTVGRMGGDEFTVLLRDLGKPQNALRVAEKILAALSFPFRIASEDLAVSASIGIAVFPDNGRNLDRLLAAADAAMYQVKHHGKQGHRLSSELPAVQPRAASYPGD
jgi:diguanylate cyclase (GGDEF)-like protein